MASKQESASKKYLNILGIVTMVLGCIIVIGGIILMALNINLADINNDYVNQLIAKANGDVNVAKMSLGLGIIFSGLFQAFLGWLERRASKTPEKSTLLLVLTVLSVVGGVFSMFNTGFKDADNAFGSVFSLTINVLALLAIIKLRSTIED